MTLSAFGSVAAMIATSVAAMKSRHARSRRIADTIHYLDGMPAYLRNDIGLAPDSDIRSIVERGPDRETARRNASPAPGLAPYTA